MNTPLHQQFDLILHYHAKWDDRHYYLDFLFEHPETITPADIEAVKAKMVERHQQDRPEAFKNGQ